MIVTKKYSTSEFDISSFILESDNSIYDWLSSGVMEVILKIKTSLDYQVFLKMYIF